MKESERGTWIPKNLQDHMLSDGCKLYHIFLVSVIHGFERSELPCFASNTYLSQQLGVCDRRARDIIKELEKLGWIKRTVTVGRSGSERILKVTSKTKEAINTPLRVEEKDLPPRKSISPNSIENNKVDNKDLTTTLMKSDEAIRCLIGKDLSIDKNHDVFRYYDKAHQWSQRRENVDIPKNPNTSVINNLLFEYDTIGDASDFIFFLDGRWIERNVKQRTRPVNLSWLLLLDCHDDQMKDGILSCEGDAEYTISAVNQLVIETRKEDYALEMEAKK